MRVTVKPADLRIGDIMGGAEIVSLDTDAWGTWAEFSDGDNGYFATDDACCVIDRTE